MAWESVSVAPVRTPDGRVTVPEEVIHSMQRNKIGLKGRCEYSEKVGVNIVRSEYVKGSGRCTRCVRLRSSGDTGGERSSFP